MQISTSQELHQIYVGVKWYLKFDFYWKITVDNKSFTVYLVFAFNTCFYTININKNLGPIQKEIKPRIIFPIASGILQK